MLKFSESQDFPPGKKITDIGTKSRKHHFGIGINDDQPIKQTVTKYFHSEKPLPQKAPKPEYGNTSHFEISHGHTKDPKSHFESLSRINYTKYENVERTLPVRNKVNLLADTGSYGEEKSEYKTTSMAQYTNKIGIKVPDIEKNKKIEKYDILKNEKIPEERVKNANNFDFFNSQRSKSKTSNNLTDFPNAFIKKDIISGRILPTSKIYTMQKS